jgi:phosphonate transport system ATP-binding protein
LKLELFGTSYTHPAAKAGASPAFGPANLVFSQGEQVAIIGPSGAGKTTLLHGIACALKPQAGTITLDQQNPWSLSVKALQLLRSKLFLAPQMPPLPQRQRVITSVLAAKLPSQSLWASIRSLFYPTDIAGADAALTRFDLGPKLWDRVDRLSGGERQRVGLARALVSNATLWLVDEPLSALDPSRSKQAIETLTSAARERNITLICTLHQVEVALEKFERVVGLREGQLIFDLPAAQVTQAMLAQLYASYEDELRGPAPAHEEIPSSPLPAVMHCR